MPARAASPRHALERSAGRAAGAAGRGIDTARAGHGCPGLKLLPDGTDALATRLALIHRARVSVDLQTYLIADDASGRQLLQALQRAADRGVRVRLLVDDLHAAAHDARLAALDRHPHVEVRLFNPLPVRLASPRRANRCCRCIGFERINRRMHNKLFIADGSLALVGGRNVGDDYFMRSSVGQLHRPRHVASRRASCRSSAQVIDRLLERPAGPPSPRLVPATAGAAVAQGRTSAGQRPPDGVAIHRDRPGPRPALRCR